MATEQVEKDALRIAWVTADHHNEMIEGARQFLYSLAQMPVMYDEDPEVCGAFLSDLKASNPRYTNILKVDLTGFI